MAISQVMTVSVSAAASHHHSHNTRRFVAGAHRWHRDASSLRCAAKPSRAVTTRASAAIEHPPTYDLFSPSKVNLFLRVVRRREDGYHDLASLFHVIDLGDDMSFALSSSESHDTLVCETPGIPLDATNLVIKAFSLFRRKTGLNRFFWCELKKRVPSGAGLGGGSGNAATALWAANELCGKPASEADLLAWSGEIGSDISVFFSTGAAYCTGRGEIVESVTPPLPLTTPLLLVKPEAGCPTPTIFKALDLSTRSTADPLELMRLLNTKGSFGRFHTDE